MEQLLTNKNAVIYGAGGSLGGAVARAFASEGARVFLTGRRRGPLEAVAADIGDAAEVTELDALDEPAVEAHADEVVGQAGGIDVSFNLITRGDLQQIPLVDLSAEDFTRPVTTGLLTNFLTARAAARRMSERGSGVILHLNSGSGRATSPGMGGTGPADAAIETFMRYLATEIGPAGVRVVGIHTAAVEDTLTREKLEAHGAKGVDPADVSRAVASLAMLRRSPRSAQIADTAAFLASDRAAAITGTVVNATAGLVLT